MCMNGNLTFFQSTGLNSNKKTYIRASDVQRSTGKNVYDQSIPGTNNSPNTTVDFIGTNNRQWTVQGLLPLRSGIELNEGFGRLVPSSESLTSTELEVSGLGVLEVTGSPLYFYDEGTTLHAKMDAGVLTFGSIVQVEVKNVTLSRNTEYTASSYEVGYILPYTITLVETK